MRRLGMEGSGWTIEILPTMSLWWRREWWFDGLGAKQKAEKAMRLMMEEA